MRPAAVVTPPAVVRRRRGEEGHTLTRASFTLHEHIVAEVKAAVSSGLAANASAFVEDAVQEKLGRVRRAALYRAYGEASADLQFMAEMETVTRDFESTASDGLNESRR